MQQIIRVSGDGSLYINKRLLVGISYENHKGDLLRQEQFHGTIVEASEKEVILQRSDTGARQSLPPELIKAPPGEYRLRATGEVVVNPDYLCKWVLNESDPNGDSAS